ncbi:unnamed protein product [Rhodiola kirilowii]
MKELSSTVQQLSGSVQQLSTTLHKNQAKNDGAIADLKKQMSQLATSMFERNNEPGQLPSQIIQNPKENVNVVTLRSGRKLAVEPMEQAEDKSPRLPGEEQMRPETRGTLETETSKIHAALPFPVPARVPKQHAMDEDVFELFSKVEINIPLLEAIKQIPRYAKFLKELCTNRRRSNRNDEELMRRDVSAVMQRKVPPKCGDPGTYNIPCTIGNI